jgi:predicted small metal-binding protein
MTKVLKCSDVTPGCNFEIRGNSEDEVPNEPNEHAQDRAQHAEHAPRSSLQSPRRNPRRRPVHKESNRVSDKPKQHGEYFAGRLQTSRPFFATAKAHLELHPAKGAASLQIGEHKRLAAKIKEAINLLLIVERISARRGYLLTY